jgi:oligopeptide/dipeptide ABC transporter ATP-binding protein
MKPLLSGEVANPGNLPPGCAFNPRCPHATDVCRRDVPDLVQGADGTLVACHHCKG